MEEVQASMCLPHKIYEPQSDAVKVYEELFALYRKVYFAFGERSAAPVAMGDILPRLIEIRSQALQG